MGSATNHLSRRLAGPAAALCAALLALILAAGCGGGGKASKSAPTSGAAWGDALEYTGGVNPSLAATSDGWVVEFHEAGGRDHIWCNVGRFADDGSFKWQGEPVDRGTGVEPGVAMTDDGLLVAVHRARNGNGLWYEVGKLDKNAGTISWLHEAADYDTGSYPRVVIFNDGWVLETHTSTMGVDDKWYKVGQLNTANNTIDFGAAASLEGSTSIGSFKDTDKFVQLMTGPGPYHQPDMSCFYRFGRLDKQNRTISWMGPKKQAPGMKSGPEHPDMRLQSLSTSPYMGADGSYKVPYIGTGMDGLYVGLCSVVNLDTDPYISVVQQTQAGSGQTPTLASSKGRTIEMHKSTSSTTKTLWYSTGNL